MSKPFPLKTLLDLAQVLTQSEDWLVMPDMIRHPVPRTLWIADQVRNDKFLNSCFGHFYLPQQSQRSY